MDLLKTLLVYMSMVFVASVQTAPKPTYLPSVNDPTPTPFVEMAATPSPEPTPKPSPVPTIGITPNPGYKTIKVGDNGDGVRDLQQKLAEYGYYAGDVDGRFGNQTRRAVEKFQYQHGLSADGIAGKNTLTVLFESKEVRKAPVEATVAPPDAANSPAADELKAAITDGINTSNAEPSASPAADAEDQNAIAEVSASAQPDASATDTTAPSATPIPEFLPLDGYTIVLAGAKEPLPKKIKEGETSAYIAPYGFGKTVYVPFLSILEGAAMNIITSNTLELDEYAFALNSSIYRIAFSEDQTGAPINLEVYKDNVPQILPERDIKLAEGAYYLPMESFAALTGITFVTDEASKLITVTLPANVTE